MHQHRSEHDDTRARARALRAELDHLREELAQLRDALHLRDDFIAMLGHQLRNPLAPLVLTVQLLEQQLADAPERLSQLELQERMRSLADGLQRFVVLLDRVFDTSCIATGHLVLHPAQVDLADEVVGWIDRHQQELRAAECALTCDVVDRVVGSWDRGRVDQIIDSLLGNAVRYGSGHPIEVRVSREGNHAVLVVQDHGIGIDQAEHQRVFERYVRGSCGRRASGLGLGLWLVDELSRAMGGDVSLDSELGRGATFRVRLPAARERER